MPDYHRPKLTVQNSLISVLHLYILVLSLLLCPTWAVAGDGKTRVIAAEVYIDDFQLPTPVSVDSALDHGFAAALGQIDLTGFAPGSHTVYLHFKDDREQWSQPIGQSVYVYADGKTTGQGGNNTLLMAEMFIDIDPGEGNGIATMVPNDGVFDETVERVMMTDAVQALAQGLHSVYLRFQDANGNWSVPVGQSFYIAEKGASSGGISAGSAFGIKAAEAYFDTDPGEGAGLVLLNTATAEVGLSGDELRALVDIAQLSSGIHTLYIRYQNKSNFWSTAIAQSVYVSPQQAYSSANGDAQTTIIAAEYAVDNGVYHSAPAADGAFGGLVELVDFEIPLTSDYHAVNVRFSDSKGRSSNSDSIANATPNDTDWDGLPDTWELANLGGTGYSGHDDPDGDGLSNAQEFEAGSDPLVKDVNGIVTISGVVSDVLGNGVAGANICIEINALLTDCSITTDGNGYYALGEDGSLAPFIYRVYPVANIPLQDFSFNPASRSVALANHSVSQINFTAETLVLTLAAPVDSASYHSAQEVSLAWTGNGGAERLMALSMKRDSVPPGQLIPTENDPNWHRFTIDTTNDGIEVVTLPIGLTPADDWRFYVAYDNTNVSAVSPVTFSYEELVVDYPQATIINHDPLKPVEGEQLTLTGQSGLDVHTIVRHYWAAVSMQNGVAVGEEIEIGSDAIVTVSNLAAGDWRFIYQVQDDQGLASEKATLDLTLLSADGLADLAINRSSVRFVDQDGNTVIQANPGDNITIEVDVHNAGRSAMTETAVVSVLDDLPSTGNLFETAAVRVLDIDETQKLIIPWIVPATQGYQSVVFNVDFVSNVGATETQVFESNNQNNLATAFLIIGTPPPGSYGINMTATAPVTVIRGTNLSITGDAHYMWGSQLPVMGALVTMNFDAENTQSRSTSPNGRYGIAARAPDALGQYQVKVRVYDNNLYSERVLLVQVIDPPPAIVRPSFCELFPCIEWTPPEPTLVPDMYLKELHFVGSGLYRTDSGQDAVVIDSSIELNAQVKNVGNLTATGGFSVRFHDAFDVQIGDVVVYSADIAPNTTVNISASEPVVLNALGNKTLYATVLPVAGETNQLNNAASESVEVRLNRPDLRDYRGLSFSSQPIAGDSVEVILDVVNRGPADLNQTFSVAYYKGDPEKGGALIEQQTLNGYLNKGDATRSSMILQTQIEEDIDIYAVIDVNDVIDEDAEYNNVVHARLHVCSSSLNQSVDLRASNHYPGMGENIQLSATVTNRCGLASSVDSMEFYSGDPNNGGLLIGTVAVPAVAGGSYTSVTLPWTTSTLPGETVLYARLSSNQTADSTSVFITTTPVPTPDLQVYADDIFRISPVAGEAVQLSTFIRNVSSLQNTSNFAVNFFIDSASEYRQVGDTIIIEQELAIESQMTVSANDTFIADEPFYAIHVQIIPNIEQGDSNITDNEASTSFQIDELVSISEMPVVSLLSAHATSSGLVTGSFTVSHATNQVKKLRVHYSNTPTFAGSLYTDIGTYADLQATGEKTFSFDVGQWTDQTVYYKVEVFSITGVQTLPAPTENIFISSINLPTITSPSMVDAAVLNEYSFRVELGEALPAGYGVFLNFDDQQGEWFVDNTPGGHVAMNDLGGGVYELDYIMKKPGLRSVRAGIFDTQDIADDTDDILVGGYSNGVTCTLDSCIEAALGEHRSSIGNPAVAGAGSELYKNVDVASGNYHLSISDISVPGKGPSFNFTRAYNSMADAGKQWSFAYEMKAQYKPDSFDRILAIGPREDGRIQYYFKDINKLWYALNAGNFDQLIERSDGELVLYTQGNRLYRFASLKPTSVNPGQLIRIEDRLGNALRMDYDSNGLLARITDANNRYYDISRDASERIQRVTENLTGASGRFVEYSYDSNNMIASVRNVRGQSDLYSYAGNTGDSRYRLAAMTDPRGYVQVAIQYDAKGRVDDFTEGLGSLNNTQGYLTDIRYGTAYPDGPQATGIVPPAVGALNHNRVYVLDEMRTRVEEFIDAKDWDENATTSDVRTKKAYAFAPDRKLLATQGLVVSTVEPNNVSTNSGEADASTSITYTGDGKGNPESIIDAATRTTVATYTEDKNQTNLTPVATILPPGVTKTTRFSAFTATGKASLITDARDYQTVQTYGDSNNGNNDWLVQSKNARNFITHYQHDAKGNTSGVTDALSQSTTATHDDLGRVLTEISPRGLTTTYTYDAAGNVLTRREQGNGFNYLTQYGYDASGNMSFVIDPRNHQTDYSYDALNRKIGESYTVNSALYTRNYVYDALGRLQSTTNERDNTSTTEYTERSQVAKRINPRNETTVTYSYDKTGNVITQTDAEGRSITTTYDVLNRKTQVIDDEANLQKWTYNTAGQVATFTDARNNLTQYFYDDVGNLIKVIDAVDGITESTYDGNGNVLTVTGPRLASTNLADAPKTTYTYDALDRRLTTTLNPDSNGSKQWIYSHDDVNGITTKTTPTGEKTETFTDELNRVSQLIERAANGSITRQISYTYDENGNVRSKTSGGNTINMTYDVINRVISVTDQNNQTISYGYDKVGNRTSLTYPGNKTVSYVFDAADRLENLTDWLNAKTSYTRNEAGQPTQVINGNGTKNSYTYDDAGRLTLLENRKADNTVISSHQLTLDAEGNIENSVMDIPLLPQLPPDTGSMNYDNNNRLLQAGTDTFTHDNTGRIIQQDNSGVQTIYNFDINDHITSITKGGATLSSYAYDQNNNRISQIQHGIETRYVIDELAALPNVIAETNNLGVVSNYYIYGDGLVSQISAANDAHYYHYDQTGHTLALTDASGNVSDSYAYTPYGLTTSQGTTHNPFKFVGKYGVMDDGDGLHYMRARYYKEDIKRFVSLDALHGDMMTPQALNRYAYVQGNPVTSIDPDGLSAENATYRELTVIALRKSLEFYMKNKKNVGYILKHDGKMMRYEVFSYTNKTIKAASAGIKILASGYFAATDTYDACKDDNGSMECISKAWGIYASTACAPLTLSGPVGVAAAVVCGEAVSGLTEAVVKDMYMSIYHLGGGVHKISASIYNISQDGVASLKKKIISYQIILKSVLEYFLRTETCGYIKALSVECDSNEYNKTILYSEERDLPREF